jgi:GTP cyclohydrolase I
MTVQITDFLEEILKPAGIIVFVKARHFCMCARGVNQDAQTTTIVARGKLRKDSSLKEEFFHSIKLEV